MWQRPVEKVGVSFCRNTEKAWPESFSKYHSGLYRGGGPWLGPWRIGKSYAAAKSLLSCPTLCGPIDGSPPGSPIPETLQARTLEWVAISFSSAWRWKVKVKLLSRVWLLATPWTVAHQAPPSMGFSRQEYWSGVQLPSLVYSVYYIIYNYIYIVIYIYIYVIKNMMFKARHFHNGYQALPGISRPGEVAVLKI